MKYGIYFRDEGRKFYHLRLVSLKKEEAESHVRDNVSLACEVKFKEFKPDQQVPESLCETAFCD